MGMVMRFPQGRCRQVLLLLTLQVVGVGTGVWLFGAFATREHTQHEERHILSQLKTVVRDAQGVAGRSAKPGVDGWASAAVPLGVELMRIDPGGRTFRLDADQGESQFARIVSHSGWRAQAANVRRIRDIETGVVREYPGFLFASSTDVGDERGTLMAIYPLGLLKGHTDSMHGALLSIAIVAFLWTITIVGISTAFVLTRVDRGKDAAGGERYARELQSARMLVQTRDAVIFGLAKLAESRDQETGEHLQRISAYTTLLAEHARRDPRYANQITAAFIRDIGLGSVLHDIGKVGIEDAILRKPGEFTPEEHGKMQAHTVIGGDCLREIERRLGSSNFLQTAREVAYGHHERWDGTGYPLGLAGDAIPLAARLVAIADVYDALASRRVYKGAIDHEDCVRIIQQDAGSHFDPGLVDVFLRVHEHIRRIAERLTPTRERRAGIATRQLNQTGDALVGNAR